jgi:hypothetical protein
VKTQSGEFIYDSTEVSALPLVLFGAGETLLPPAGRLLRLGAGPTMVTLTPKGGFDMCFQKPILALSSHH